MSKVAVRVPFAGEVTVYVGATGMDREELEEKALTLASEHVALEIRPQNTDVEIGEWDCMEAICEGNVLHAPLERIEIDEDWDEFEDEEGDED